MNKTTKTPTDWIRVASAALTAQTRGQFAKAARLARFVARNRRTAGIEWVARQYDRFAVEMSTLPDRE